MTSEACLNSSILHCFSEEPTNWHYLKVDERTVNVKVKP